MDLMKDPMKAFKSMMGGRKHTGHKKKRSHKSKKRRHSRRQSRHRGGSGGGFSGSRRS